MKEFEAGARSRHDITKALNDCYPGPGKRLEGDATIACNDEIRTARNYRPLRSGGEIFFIPKIEGQ